MKSICYVEGDATQPQGEGNKIIAHVCNDIGRWGKGFVVALSKRSKQPELAFREWFANRQNSDFRLGAVQFVSIEPDVWVANMVGQHQVKVKGDGGVPPIRYEALEQALISLGERAESLGASVHMPRIGCGLAGGQWMLIEPLILRHLSEREVEVFIYDWN